MLKDLLDKEEIRENIINIIWIMKLNKILFVVQQLCQQNKLNFTLKMRINEQKKHLENKLYTTELLKSQVFLYNSLKKSKNYHNNTQQWMISPL